MKLPPFFYAKAFWEALSFLVAGALALLVYFGALSPQFGLTAGAVLAAFLAVLKFFNITPELRDKGLIP